MGYITCASEAFALIFLSYLYNSYSIFSVFCKRQSVNNQSMLIQIETSNKMYTPF